MMETAQQPKWKHLLIAGIGGVLTVAVGLALARTLTSPDWQEAVTYVGMATYVLTVLVNPLLGLLLWVSTSPFARFLYLNISLGSGIPDLSLDRIAAAVILVLLLAQLAIRKRRFADLTWIDLSMAAFLIGTAVSMPAAIAGTVATVQNWFDAQAVPLIIYFLAKNLVTTKSAHKAFLITLLFMGAYLSFLVIHEQLTGNILFYPMGRTVRYTTHIRRVVGLLGNPAFFATILGMILPFAIKTMLETKNKTQRWLLVILNGAIGYAIFLCYNRAGWLAAAIVLVFMAIFLPRFRKLFIVMLCVAGVLVAVFWVDINNSYVVTERLTAEGPVDYRMNAIDIAFRMVSSNLLFGRGYGNFGFLYGRYASDWTQVNVLPAPHNTYMNVLVSSGLMGFIPFVGIFALIFLQGFILRKRGLRNRAIDRGLVMCLSAAVLVYAETIFFSDIVGAPYVTSVFFFIVGAVLGYQERADRWGDPKEWLA